MSDNEAKAIRLVEYLTRLASLRAKTIRDVAEYTQTLWLHEIPHEKGCFTQAWGPDEEFDQDIWIELQTTHEPALPPVPELCRDWLNRNTIRNTKDLPELLREITKQYENPEWEEGSEQPQFINQKLFLDAHPEVIEAWDKYVELKWMPWAEEHQKWSKVHKVYTALFAVRQEQLRLGEEYELILAIGLLTWQTPNKQKVRRHLIVANALLEFEARLGKFTVRPNPDGANIRPELDMLDIEEQPARAEEAAKTGLSEAADDPWDQDCVKGVLNALVHSINPDAEYHDRLETNRPQYTTKPTVEFAPALILRKRSIRGLTEILKRIKNRIEDGEIIPPEFEDIAEIQQSKTEDSPEADVDTAPLKNTEIYFPKASNSEQKQIVEKLRSASGILVQGPPGTGKSHTIANLICHLLATGQRTLITAKTPRALRVLERLLPEELRPLCINLLGSGLEEKQSLEASVRAVLQKNAQWKDDLAQKEIQERQGSLHKLRQEKIQIENRLRAIRESETHSQTIAGGAYQGTAAQIAQAVTRDEHLYGWFIDLVPFDGECPISEESLFNLLRGLRTLTPQIREELDLAWPNSIPSAERFRSLISKEQKAEAKESSTSTNIDNEFLKAFSQQQEEILRSIHESFANLRNELLRLRSLPYSWVPDAIRDISLGNDAIWQELRRAHIRYDAFRQAERA
jgi:hypothetical protein